MDGINVTLMVHSKVILALFIYFFIRNGEGDIVGVKGRRLPDLTSIVVEAVTLSDAIHFCVERNSLPLIVETNFLTVINITAGT